MDPLAVLTLISEGLTLVDKFTEVTRRWFGKEKIPSVLARKEGDTLKIESEGQVREQIEAGKLEMSAWDEKRYKTLYEKVKVNFDMYNDIDVQLPTASVDEKARLKQKLENIRKELCKDFREMIRIYENTLRVPLEDHYTLYDTCQDL